MTSAPLRHLSVAALTLAAGLCAPSAFAQTTLFAAVSGDGTVIKVDLDHAGQITVTTSNLNTPYGLGFDSHGQLLVADTDNNAIKMIGPGGTQTTVFSGLNYPSGFAVDCDDNLSVANFGDGNFLELSGGKETLIAGGFNGPISVRPYRRQDWGMRPTARIYALTYRGDGPGGVVLFRHNADGTWTNLQTVTTNLNYAYDAVPDRAGNLFVSELGSGRILEFPAASGGLVSTNPIVFAAQLSPVGLLFDHRGNLYEADYGGAINQFIFSNGTLSTNPVAVVTGLNAPTYLAFPPPPFVRIRPAGDTVVLTWPDALFALQAANALPGTFTTIPGAASPYTNVITGAMRFFRLVSK